MMWLLFLLSAPPKNIESFWAFDWGFFKSYYSIPAKLANIDTTGGHCLIYLAKDTMTVRGLAYSPNGNQLYSIGGVDKVYKSTDYGNSWALDKEFSGITINQILIQTGIVSKKIMLATSSGFYYRKSTGWIAYNNGVLDTVSDRNLTSIAVAPDENIDTFYVYGSIGDKVYYLINENPSITDWSYLGQTPDSSHIYKLMGVPGDTGFYALTQTGIYYYNKGTGSWAKKYGIDTTITPVDIEHAKGSDAIFYLLTDKGLLKSTDKGATWSTLLTDTTLTGVYPLGGDSVYVLTENGLKFSSNGTNFVDMNDGLLDDGIPPYATDVKSMVVIDDTTKILGTVEGLFRWESNKWVMANEGIFHSFVSQETVQRIYDIFEHTTPAHPDSGVWDIVTNAFGTPATDVDSFPKIIIFLIDMKEGYSQAGMHLEHMSGYFDPVNEHTQYYVENFIDENYKTNTREMIYINVGDNDALNLTDTVAIAKTLAHNLARMLYYKEDPKEWGSRKVMNDGCPQSTDVEAVGMLAEYLVAVGAGNKDTLQVYKFPAKNDLFRFGDAYLGDNSMDANTEDMTAYMWAMYLYEHYGIPLFKDMMADTSGTGVQSVDYALSKVNATLTTKDVFSNFIVACALDDPNLSNGKYGFKYINTNIVLSTFMPGVGASQYPIIFTSTPPWSYDGVMISLSYPISAKPDTIRYNGKDSVDLRPYVFKWKDDTTFYMLDSIVMDTTGGSERNIGDYYIGDFYSGSTYKIVYLLNVNRDTVSATGIISDDRTPPAFVRLGVIQNPLAPKYLDIYGYTSEPLYRDVEAEYPEIDMDTIPLELELFATPGTDSLSDVYYAEGEISDTGIVDIKMDGEDFAGNRIPVLIKQVSISRMSAGKSVVLYSPDKRLTLSISRDAVPAGSYIVVSNLSDVPKFKNSGDVYSISSPAIPIRGDVNISFEVEHPHNDLGIYRWDGSRWEYIGGYLKGNIITTKIDKFGIYGLRRGAPPTPVCNDYSLDVKQVSNSGFLLSYTIPDKSSIDLSIYDIAGRHINTVQSGVIEAGIHTAKVDLSNYASGVYFFRLLGKKSLTKRIILLK